MVLKFPAELCLWQYFTSTFCAICSAGVNAALWRQWIRNVDARKNDFMLMMIAFSVFNGMHAFSFIPSSMHATLGWQRNGTAARGFTASGVFWSTFTVTGMTNALTTMRIFLILERIISLCRPMSYRYCNKPKLSFVGCVVAACAALLSWIVYLYALNTDHEIGDCWFMNCNLSQLGVDFFYIFPLSLTLIAFLMSLFFVYNWWILKHVESPVVFARCVTNDDIANKRKLRMNNIFVKQLGFYFVLEIVPATVNGALFCSSRTSLGEMVGPVLETLIAVDSFACAMLYATNLMQLVAKHSAPPVFSLTTHP